MRADLPGMRKEDVNVEVDDNRLTIPGERSHEFEEDRDDFYRSERSYDQVTAGRTANRRTYSVPVRPVAPGKAAR